mgnify:FL=1|tara:strand:- start:853 stop:1101 length:249 start_codon:yes stop_codon:yes gene_type:complete
MLKATIWCKDNCVYCSLAQKELHKKEYEIEKRNIDHIWSKEDLQKVVPNAKTVPQIFIGDKYIGGYSELMTYFEETTSNYGH